MANNNLDALAKAAKVKLEAQNKQPAPNENIYADLMKEADEDVAPSYQVSQQVPVPNTNYNFEYNEELDEDFEISEENEPIFEGGPGKDQIDIWKKEYGESCIFHTKILEKHFVFRTLKRFEYKQIVAIENIDPLHREEIICSTVTLWPHKYDFKKMAKDDGGYPSTLAQIIMENSGFTKEYGIEIL